MLAWLLEWLLQCLLQWPLQWAAVGCSGLQCLLQWPLQCLLQWAAVAAAPGRSDYCTHRLGDRQIERLKAMLSEPAQADGALRSADSPSSTNSRAEYSSTVLESTLSRRADKKLPPIQTQADVRLDSSISALSRHYAGMGVPVLEITASSGRSF